MTKKKPDFLRDLDTAIMDELTGGGIKGNAAGLVGTLTQIKEIKQLCGLPFCGYMAKLETVRPSGVPDEVTVVFAEDVPYRACNGIEFDVMQEFVEGSRLLLTGKVQTLKDFQSGRLLVYILADFVAVSEKAVEQLAGMVDSLKQCQTPQEVYDRYLQITGYCKCCVDCNFIDQKGADELMCLAAYLAGNEQARAEAQQKAGKKA